LDGYAIFLPHKIINKHFTIYRVPHWYFWRISKNSGGKFLTVTWSSQHAVDLVCDWSKKAAMRMIYISFSKASEQIFVLSFMVYFDKLI